MKKILLISIALLFSIGVNAQNNCLEFDGSDDYVSCGNILTNSLPLAEFTIEFWMKLHSTQEAYMGVFGQQTTAYSSDNFSISFYCGDEANRFGMTGSWSDDVTGNRSSFDNRTTMPFGTGVWKHVATTFDGTTMKMFVDGVLIKESNNYGGDLYAGKSLGNTHDFLLGKTLGYGSGVTTHFFDGEIDEFRIWDNARTETEIRQNMYQELPDPASETKLVAYYKFNETYSATTADSKGSNTGSLENMTGEEFVTSAAMFGPKNCLEFDGVYDRVEVNTTLSPAFTQGTISFWIKPKATPTNHARVFSDNWNDDEIYLQSGTGKVATFYMINGGDLMSSNPLPNNTWTHVAITMDNTSSQLYINGILDGVSGSSATDISSDFEIGGYSTSTIGDPEVVNGYLDEFRIWSVVRTEEEIREYMCKNLTGNEDNLIAYYGFDNASGTTLQDFSGNGHDGTLTNMTNDDWVSSSAFNTWLNTSSNSWSTATNWSRGSVPASTDNVGVYSYTGGTDAALSGSPTLNNLVLGTSSSMTLSSGATVNGNLILESNLDLNGQTITLGSDAMLMEDVGLLSGSSGDIRTTRSLNNISSENVAGLGAEITTSANMGSTTISRSHAANSSPASIERRYSITPTNNSELNATLVFHYNANELNSLTESYLELSKSTDGGNIWTNQESSVNTFVKTITLSGIDGFSLWTAMESANTTPPIVDTDDPTHSFTTGTTAITIAPNTTVTTTSDIENATISISPIVPEDILSVSGLAALGLSSSWDNTTKILAISGTGSASDYQTALRNVKFETTATADGTRTVDFILGDGVGLMISGEQHFYEVIYESGNISWTAARLAALAKRFGAAQGYLATITSITENDYLYDKLSEDTWIGASDAETEDVWKWIDGPETGIQFWQGDASGSAVNGMYENWAGGEPNDAFSNEDYAHMYCREDLQGVWNDYSNTNNVKYYIVEYGGDGSTFTTIDDATINVKSDITWDGSEGSDWNTAENWNYDVVPTAYCNITIPDAATDPVIGPTETVDCNNLSIISGATLTIESDATGTGSLIIKGTATGDVTVERYIAGETDATRGWHFLSSPLNSQSISPQFVDVTVSPIAAGVDFYRWSETEGLWINIRNDDNVYNKGVLETNFSNEEIPTFTTGKGYLVAYATEENKTFSGTLRTTDYAVSGLTNTDGKAYAGWHLLGNPFSCALDFNLNPDSWNKSAGIGAYAQIWNESAASYKVLRTEQNIPAMNGFMVYTSSNNGSLTIPADARIHSDSNWYKAPADENMIVLLAVDNQTNTSQETVINFNPEATSDFDLKHDSYFIAGFAPMFYSISGNDNYALNTLPEQTQDLVIPMGFVKNGSSDFYIELTQNMNDLQVYLIDKKMELVQKLNEGTYHFSSEENDDPDRFEIRFGIVGMEEPTSTPPFIQLWSDQNTIYLLNINQLDGKVSVINMYGQKVHETQLNREVNQQMRLDAPAGYYIVNVLTKNGVVNKKVYLK